MKPKRVDPHQDLDEIFDLQITHQMHSTNSKLTKDISDMQDTQIHATNSNLTKDYSMKANSIANYQSSKDPVL